MWSVPQGHVYSSFYSCDQSLKVIWTVPSTHLISPFLYTHVISLFMWSILYTYVISPFMRSVTSIHFTSPFYSCDQSLKLLWPLPQSDSFINSEATPRNPDGLWFLCHCLLLGCWPSPDIDDRRWVFDLWKIDSRFHWHQTQTTKGCYW